MAIVSITERNYKTAKSTDKKYEFQVEYIVVTDSSTGPEEIRRLPEFEIGRQYNFGADSNPNTRLQSVSISRMSEDSRTQWLVACNFSTVTRAGGGGDGGGGGGDDPFKPPRPTRPPSTNTREETFEVRFTSVTEPMYYGKWLGSGTLNGTEGCCPWQDAGFDGPSPKYPPAKSGNGVYPLVNSAGQPIESPPSVQKIRPVFRYVLNIVAIQANYLQLISMAGRVNSDPVTIMDLTGEVLLEASPGTLRCIVSNMEPMPDWEASSWFNFEFEYEQCGHGELVPDKGRMFYFDAEDIATEGVAGGTRADIVKVDGVEVGRDEIGDPLEEEVWLNGRGRKNPGSDNYFHKWVPATCFYTTFNDKIPFSKLGR